MELKSRHEQLEPALARIARADLRELGDIRIDDVLLFIDRGLENMPSYMDLYRRWESQQWAVSDLDFGPDRENWLSASQLDKDATLWGRRLFFTGEERVTATLAPFVWAAPTPEIEVFLSTQMADEARHTVFFDRWWREVVQTGIAQRMASDPRDLDAFIEGITIYHIVVEATLALTGQRFELESMREMGLTHFGFYQGFTAVARDESRHVNFGIKVLQEAVRQDPERFAPLIQRTLVECLPLISGTLEPPDPRYFTEFGRSHEELLQFAMTSLNKRLHAIGINLAA
jgi:ribonucleoside-diphosphate reductase beta chain